MCMRRAAVGQGQGSKRSIFGWFCVPGQRQNGHGRPKCGRGGSAACLPRAGKMAGRGWRKKVYKFLLRNGVGGWMAAVHVAARAEAKRQPLGSSARLLPGQECRPVEQSTVACLTSAALQADPPLLSGRAGCGRRHPSQRP